MITRFFCRKCRDYSLFGVEFWQKFWQKFLEILRILAEILRKKLATGASDLAVLFVIWPVFLLFSHGQSVSEQLQLLIYALLSLKCRELHLRVF